MDMRKIYYLLVLCLAFFSCQDDKLERFAIDMPENAFRFTPVAGGAIMHYTLPDDPEIVAVNLRYRDALGQQTLRTGSYANDSLLIVGFNEGETEVTGEVTICKYDGSESNPIPVVFNTLDSGPVSFIKAVDVEPSWDGFLLHYRDIPENVNGMAHVFYIGINPYTQEQDTLLVNSFVIEEGSDTLTFALQQQNEVNTVVIRTEDFRGYMVSERVWEGVEAYLTEKFPLSVSNLTYPTKSKVAEEGAASIEDPSAMLGLRYLFDGDIKAETCWDLPTNRYKTFLAGPHAAGEDSPPMYLDLGEKKLIAEVRGYCMLNHTKEFRSEPYYSLVWHARYYNKLPNSITVYASNDEGDWESKSWIKIGEFSEDRDLDITLRWCARCAENRALLDEYKTLEELQAADPAYFSISLPANGQGDGYRYLKIKYNDIFGAHNDAGDQNNDKFLSLHELEVYTKKN